MKNYFVLALLGLLSLSCNGQNTALQKTQPTPEDSSSIEVPKGSWKVDKEYDKNGNLIKYDSIYTWSSNHGNTPIYLEGRDSIFASFASKFMTELSGFDTQGFEAFFSRDSLLRSRLFHDDFFGSDFGPEFMNMDQLRQQMINRQKELLEKYQAESHIPKGEN